MYKRQPEEDEARVIVPADSAYTNEQDTVIKVPTPVIEGRDISYPMRIRQAKDYFFDIPEEEPKYIAYARKGEPLFLQASTSRLKGRKLFVWGQGTGSQHWQNFLTREAGRYCEIQAGLAKTQYGCIPMGAGETWESVSYTHLYCPVFGGADPDFSGRVADNLPLVIRGRQYRRRDRLGELLADHFPDDQPYDSGQRGLHRHRSA